MPERTAANIKRLAYFERFFDPIAERTLAARPEIELVRLRYDRAERDAWSEISRSHGYQIQPRGELREPWFGDAALLERCPSLLAICSSGAGYDMIDVDACTAAGVIVCNQSGFNKEAVAEHALGFMLSLSKKIALADKMLRREGVRDRFRLTGNDIRGKTVGVIGIGQIGTRTAELCRVLFGMTVLACDPYLTAEQVKERGAAKVELTELLRRSDFVTLHCPRTRETMGMIGRAELALMKPTAFFISTARGGIHREDDLADALRAGTIAGAGLDVFLEEPPRPDHPLLAFDTVIASPHTAGVTEEALYDMAVATAEQWIAIFAGGTPPRLVNPAAWPRYAERFERLLGFAPAPLSRGV
ncbi:MAG TPA: hydroxyacid dehydrogenase [Stellaceae bacterium]|nr:hydroxyacid dehydrogenase [Stellaceae bacterium]